MSRPNKVWFRKSHKAYYVEYEGVQHRLCEGPPCQQQKKKAEVCFARLIVSLTAADFPTEQPLTVSDLFAKYKEFSRRRLEKKTFYELNRHLQSFEIVNGKKEVSKLIVNDLSTWVDSHVTWKSDDTRANGTKSIKTAFSWGRKQGLISKDPFQDFCLSFRNHRRPMTDQEFTRLLQAVPTHQYRFARAFRFIRLTGARPSEIRKIRWFEIDYTRSVIVLKQHKARGRQKVPKDRQIILVPEAVEILKEIKEQQLQDQEKTEYVFVSSRGTPWSDKTLGQILLRIRQQIGIPEGATLYGLRHRYGTRAITQGVDIKTVAELMGHTSTQMTEHYLHLAGELTHLRTAAMKIAKASSQDSSSPQPTEDIPKDPSP